MELTLNNVLIFSDLHITQSSLKECISILEEIGMLANKYNCDTLINLGDTFDNLKPTSSELDIFSTFIRRLNKKIIIIAADSHESTTQEESIINHFGILNNMVTVVKEFKDANHLYCGHFSIKESSKNYDAKLSKEDLKQYLYCFLGHIHTHELIKPNIVHVGSCRYTNFDEARDKQKIVVLITDYGTEVEKVHFMKLKYPIPMIQLELKINNDSQGSKDTVKGENVSRTSQNQANSPSNKALSDIIAKLDKTDPKTKVKVVIKDFESFRGFLPFVNKYTTKFEIFKYETDFTVVSIDTQKCRDTETKSFKESFTFWLRQQNVDQKVREILEKEIE